MSSTNNSLDIIKGSSLLEEKDFQIIKDLQEELEDTFQKAQIFRTEVEMEISVLNDIKHPTPDSKYWQAVKEQNVMYIELVSMSYEYRKNSVQLRRLERDINITEDEFDKEDLQIEKEKLIFLMRQQERTAKDRIREIGLWHDIKESLIPHMKYGTKDVNAHQLEGYTRRFINQSHIMGDSGSLPERQNLIGQLSTSISKMKHTDKELWESIEKILPK